MTTFAKALFVIFAILLVPSLTYGQDYVRYRLPAGTRLIVAGATYQGFNLGEYRELLHMDDDLRVMTDVHTIDLARIAQLVIASGELQLSVTSCLEEVTVLTGERTRLTTLWEEENRLRHNAENQPDWTWVPWSLAGGFAISTIILALIVGLQ